MKQFIILLSITIFISVYIGCNSKRVENGSIDVIYSIDSTKRLNQKILTVEFLNNLNYNVMISPIITWRKVTGLDQCVHINLTDYPPQSDLHTLQTNCISMSDSTPIIYFGTYPRVSEILNLHSEAKTVLNKSKRWSGIENTFLYLNDSRIAPNFLFIKSFSKSKLSFEIKNNLEVKHILSILSTNDLNKIPAIQRGFLKMNNIFKNDIKGYYFYNGNFNITSIEIGI